MLGKVKIGFWFCLSFILVGLSSCTDENIDIMNIDDEEVDPIVEMSSDSCSNSLLLYMIQSNDLDFNEESEAVLFKSGTDYNYVIYDVTWDSFGTGEPVGFFDISDGIPGISIGSSGPPMVGDTLSPIADFESMFRSYGTNNDVAFLLTGLKIMITQSGVEEGEYISGDLFGTVTNELAQLFEVKGSFCTEIVRVDQ